MKTKLLLMSMWMVFAFAFLNAQDLPPKHRGLHPRLQADGKVVDEQGKQLGYITKKGKICDVTGKVIGIIARSGEVTTANKKGIIGVIRKDGSFQSRKGYVVTNDDGVLMAQGKMVGHADKHYSYKGHACVTHCFFSEDSEDADLIDSNID